MLRSLTLALMGSDDMHLRVLAQSSSDPKEKKHAAKVLKLLQKGRHWVLVVLLLSNVVRSLDRSSFFSLGLGFHVSRKSEES
jgi:metal transporter CNNM